VQGGGGTLRGNSQAGERSAHSLCLRRNPGGRYNCRRLTEMPGYEEYKNVRDGFVVVWKIILP